MPPSLSYRRELNDRENRADVRIRVTTANGSIDLSFSTIRSDSTLRSLDCCFVCSVVVLDCSRIYSGAISFVSN